MIGREAVLEARRRVADALLITPLVPAPLLSAELGVFTAAAAWETEVVLTLETRDARQVAQLVAALHASGYPRHERIDATRDASADG